MSTPWKHRLRDALAAASIHLLLSLIVAAAAAALVWGLWYPHPCDSLSGGTALFLLIVGVDVICGPVLTSIVFDRRKPLAELRRDISLIAIIQILALGYGLHAVFESRPLYLVHEIDRFRVVTRADYLGVDISAQIDALPAGLRFGVWSGPVVVGVRPPRDARERSAVLLDAMQGGRDLAQRPDFYVPYGEAYAPTVLGHAKPVAQLLNAMPHHAAGVARVLAAAGADPSGVWTVPVVHRQNWIALIDSRARMLGFLPGDGFAVR